MIRQDGGTPRRLALAPGVKYRRESFGGVVFEPTTRVTRFFNHSAAFAIEQFANPIEVSSADARLAPIIGTPAARARVIAELLDNDIIREVPADGEVGRVFFTDVTEFPVDRLYTPLAVECELTLRCMRRCTYCAYESGPDFKTAGELSRDDWANVLRILDRHGVFYVRFTGGDPLTRPDAIEIVRDADALGFAVSLASDLTVFSQDHAVALASLNNLVALQTTLDGPNPDIADSQRGSGNFRRVLQGLQLLRSAGVPVVVGTVVTRLNAAHVGEIAALLSTFENVIGYCISPLYEAGRGRSLTHLCPSTDQLALAYEQFAEAVAKGQVKPADPAWGPLASMLTREERRELWADQPTLVRSPDRLLRIDPFGRAYTSIHLKEALGEDVYVGDVLQTEFASLWNNSRLLTSLRNNRRKHPYFGDVVDFAKLSNLMEVHDA
jgi:MoaA/NifB/PqqE/SkfB family radical SAM enzyme